MQRRKLIVVGVGFWGRYWTQVVRQHAKLDLSAIVARTTESLDRFASENNFDRNRCFTDLPAALKEVQADIVAIVSPAANHLEHVRAALGAGCHVICEKPLANHWDDAVAIAKVVEALPKQKVMVAQTRRFTSQAATLRELVVTGKIGKVDCIAFDHRVNYTGGGYRQAMELPVLEDMICHHLDAIRYITAQEPVTVYAEGWNPAWSQFSGRASNHVLATLTGGVHLTYFGSWTSRGQLNSYDGVLKIMGSDGSLDLVDAQTLHYYPYTAAEQGPSTPESLPIHSLEHRDVAGVIDHFLWALETDQQPMCNLDDNLKTFAFNWAVLRSCREGRSVNMTEIYNGCDSAGRGAAKTN